MVIQPKKNEPTAGRRKRQKQPTQHTPMQRVKVVGANGRIRFDWRPWPEKP